MKRLLALFSTVMFLVVFLLPFNAFAASASAGMSGPGTVRAGDTITVTFTLNGSGIFGGQGSLSYDSSKLTLTGTSQSIASPWVVEFNGSSFVYYDNNMATPINSSKSIFTATFKVSSSVAVGSSISVSAINLKASDGSADIGVSNASYSATIAAPLSTNNYLSSLTVGNATISPAFSKTTTKYTASVDFSVTKLNITAKTEDAAATVSISGNALAVGSNTVKITVKAPSGATQVYTITVTRAQDPNYVAGGNCALSGISINGFLLSPVFSTSVKSYVVWLPYETESIAVSATPADGKATVKVEGGSALKVGDNTIKITCTAEDGKTSDSYTITAKRAAAWGSKVETTKAASVTTAPAEESEKSSVPIWLIIVLCVLSLALGFIASMIIARKKNQDNYDDYDDDDDSDNGSDDDKNSGSGGYSNYNNYRSSNSSNSNAGSSNQDTDRVSTPDAANNSTPPPAPTGKRFIKNPFEQSADD